MFLVIKFLALYPETIIKSEKKIVVPFQDLREEFSFLFLKLFKSFNLYLIIYI